MSVYPEKIYPDIASAPTDEGPQQSQNYRLKKIEEAEKFLQDEAEKRGKLAKQFKRRAIASTISDTSLITAITILEVASVATLTTGVGAPISIVLASAGLLLGLGSGVIHKTQKVFESKTKKHDKIKTLAESKLDSISNLVSKAIKNAHISHEEYHFILKEVEHYRVIKEQIRTKSKKVADAITAEQREAILAQGREEGKQDFLRKIAATSDIPTANAM
ncbi:uncharacterized protein [Clytia hemisphaerica]|uniref:uncharacterized protein n=1 Tax=Clytia hemisphaerica TaxID=252671 RepID=UPI0034D5BCEA